jgi:hypothetical protein
MCLVQRTLATGDVRFRETTVPEYRANTVKDGHILGFDSLTCTDDAGAIEQAKRLVGSFGVELWSGDRIVIRLDPKVEVK